MKFYVSITATETKTHTVEVTESELVALMVKHNVTPPSADMPEPRYGTVVGAWCDAVSEALPSVALQDLALRPDAEITDEDSDWDIEEMCPSDESDHEEDMAWRPDPLLAVSQAPWLAPVPAPVMSLVQVMEREVPVPSGGDEWWASTR